MNNQLSFENTEIAFQHKSDKELKQARWLFSMMGRPWLVKLGTKLAPLSIRWGLPVKGLIRKTIFRQFVGGETLEQTTGVARKLEASGVDVILDYGVEGIEGEASFDAAAKEFIKVIEFASTQPNIPFMSIKVTGMARFSLLEKIDSFMHDVEQEGLLIRYHNALHKLRKEELDEWQRVIKRVKTICEVAAHRKIGFLVDAEESWIQDPVDALTMEAMEEYNKSSLIVYNTIQLYRHDRLDFLYRSYEDAAGKNYLLAVKLVRGAYMEKERRRAAELNYESPIQPDKESADRDYNAAIRFCIERIGKIGIIVASHNERSSLLAVELIKACGASLDHSHLHFSQLYGMSDNITFNLAKAGAHVSKYLPFGPIQDVVPYLMRRAQENTSVGGQTSRELNLINREIQRRN